MVVSNLTIRDSAFWSLRFWASSHVTASNLTVLAPRNVFNNDGVDIDSSTSARIENLYYDGGDDGVALKSGLGAEGAAFRLPTRGVSIRNVSVRTRSSCLCVGSEMEGGVHDVVSARAVELPRPMLVLCVGSRPPGSLLAPRLATACDRRW